MSLAPFVPSWSSVAGGIMDWHSSLCLHREPQLIAIVRVVASIVAPVLTVIGRT